MGYLEIKKRAFMSIASQNGYLRKKINGVPPLRLDECIPGNLIRYKIYGNTGKNVLKYPFEDTSKTMNGITFTDNGDGTITAAGTSTGRAVFYMTSPLTYTLPQGIYYFSGCPSGGNTNTYRMYINVLKKNGDSWEKATATTYDYGSGGSLDTRDAVYDGFTIAIEIGAGVTLENAVFKPMIEYGETSTEYESFKGVGDLTKNLIAYPFASTTRTVNGVTLTDNKDGTISVSGTPTDSLSYYLGRVDVMPGTSYYLSGMEVGKNLVFDLMAYDAADTEIDHQRSRSISFTAADNAAYVKIYIDRISSNTEIPSTVVKPQFEIGSSATEFEMGGKYKIPLVVSGKNLIPYPYIESTRTKNGITFTVNEDGTINVNGTATANAAFSTVTAWTYTLPKKVYYWSGCPQGGSASTYNSYVNILKRTETSWKIVKTIYDYGNGAVVDLQQYEYEGITLTINIASGTVMDNAIFKLMLELGDEQTEYEKYKEPKIKNIYLGQPLVDAEYIDSQSGKAIYSGTTENVLLPVIELLNGTNVFGVKTDVPPDSVEAEYHSKFKEA